MSNSSSELPLDLDNERISVDTYSSRVNDTSEKEQKNRANSKRSSSVSKSDTKSYSSQNDDRSEHFERLLEESQQSVSNRDVLIAMLQKQLKKMEGLYKQTLDQQQEIRMKYSNVVLELSHLQTICDKLKEENQFLSEENERSAVRYRDEREALQAEVDKWKKEYDQLMTFIENMEKNTNEMKNLLSEDDKSHREEVLSSNNMEKLIDQYAQIQRALASQNEKLDKFLERFQLIGDGGCTIIKSLEGIRCVNRELSKSLSSILTKEKAAEMKRGESDKRSDKISASLKDEPISTKTWNNCCKDHELKHHNESERKKESRECSEVSNEKFLSNKSSCCDEHLPVCCSAEIPKTKNGEEADEETDVKPFPVKEVGHNDEVPPSIKEETRSIRSGSSRPHGDVVSSPIEEETRSKQSGSSRPQGDVVPFLIGKKSSSLRKTQNSYHEEQVLTCDDNIKRNVSSGVSFMIEDDSEESPSNGRPACCKKVSSVSREEREIDKYGEVVPSSIDEGPPSNRTKNCCEEQTRPCCREKNSSFEQSNIVPFSINDETRSNRSRRSERPPSNTEGSASIRSGNSRGQTEVIPSSTEGTSNGSSRGCSKDQTPSCCRNDFRLSAKGEDTDKRSNVIPSTITDESRSNRSWRSDRENGAIQPSVIEGSSSHRSRSSRGRSEGNPSNGSQSSCSEHKKWNCCTQDPPPSTDEETDEYGDVVPSPNNEESRSYRSRSSRKRSDAASTSINQSFPSNNCCEDQTASCCKQNSSSSKEVVPIRSNRSSKSDAPSMKEGSPPSLSRSSRGQSEVVPSSTGCSTSNGNPSNCSADRRSIRSAENSPSSAEGREPDECGNAVPSSTYDDSGSTQSEKNGKQSDPIQRSLSNRSRNSREGIDVKPSSIGGSQPIVNPSGSYGSKKSNCYTEDSALEGEESDEYNGVVPSSIINESRSNRSGNSQRRNSDTASTSIKEGSHSNRMKNKCCVVSRDEGESKEYSNVVPTSIYDDARSNRSNVLPPSIKDDSPSNRSHSSQGPSDVVPSSTGCSPSNASPSNFSRDQISGSSRPHSPSFTARRELDKSSNMIPSSNYDDSGSSRSGGGERHNSVKDDSPSNQSRSSRGRIEVVPSSTVSSPSNGHPGDCSGEKTSNCYTQDSPSSAEGEESDKFNDMVASSIRASPLKQTRNSCCEDQTASCCRLESSTGRESNERGNVVSSSIGEGSRSNRSSRRQSETSSPSSKEGPSSREPSDVIPHSTGCSPSNRSLSNCSGDKMSGCCEQNSCSSGQEERVEEYNDAVPRSINDEIRSNQSRNSGRPSNKGSSLMKDSPSKPTRNKCCEDQTASCCRYGSPLSSTNAVSTSIYDDARSNRSNVLPPSIKEGSPSNRSHSNRGFSDVVPPSTGCSPSNENPSNCSRDQRSGSSRPHSPLSTERSNLVPPSNYDDSRSNRSGRSGSQSEATQPSMHDGSPSNRSHSSRGQSNGVPSSKGCSPPNGSRSHCPGEHTPECCKRGSYSSKEEKEVDEFGNVIPARMNDESRSNRSRNGGTGTEPSSTSSHSNRMRSNCIEDETAPCRRHDSPSPSNECGNVVPPPICDDSHSMRLERSGGQSSSSNQFHTGWGRNDVVLPSTRCSPSNESTRDRRSDEKKPSIKEGSPPNSSRSSRGHSDVVAVPIGCSSSRSPSNCSENQVSTCCSQNSSTEGRELDKRARRNERQKESKEGTSSNRMQHNCSDDSTAFCCKQDSCLSTERRESDKRGNVVPDSINGDSGSNRSSGSRECTGVVPCGSPSSRTSSNSCGHPISGYYRQDTVLRTERSESEARSEVVHSMKNAISSGANLNACCDDQEPYCCGEDSIKEGAPSGEVRSTQGKSDGVPFSTKDNYRSDRMGYSAYKDQAFTSSRERSSSPMKEDEDADIRKYVVQPGFAEETCSNRSWDGRGGTAVIPCEGDTGAIRYFMKVAVSNGTNLYTCCDDQEPCCCGEDSIKEGTSSGQVRNIQARSDGIPFSTTNDYRSDRTGYSTYEYQAFRGSRERSASHMKLDEEADKRKYVVQPGFDEETRSNRSRDGRGGTAVIPCEGDTGAIRYYMKVAVSNGTNLYTCCDDQELCCCGEDSIKEGTSSGQVRNIQARSDGIPFSTTHDYRSDRMGYSAYEDPAFRGSRECSSSPMKEYEEADKRKYVVQPGLAEETRSNQSWDGRGGTAVIPCEGDTGATHNSMKAAISSDANLYTCCDDQEPCCCREDSIKEGSPSNQQWSNQARSDGVPVSTKDGTLDRSQNDGREDQITLDRKGKESDVVHTAFDEETRLNRSWGSRDRNDAMRGQSHQYRSVENQESTRHRDIGEENRLDKISLSKSCGVNDSASILQGVTFPLVNEYCQTDPELWEWYEENYYCSVRDSKEARYLLPEPTWRKPDNDADSPTIDRALDTESLECMNCCNELFDDAHYEMGEYYYPVGQGMDQQARPISQPKDETVEGSTRDEYTQTPVRPAGKDQTSQTIENYEEERKKSEQYHQHTWAMPQTKDTCVQTDFEPYYDDMNLLHALPPTKDVHTQTTGMLLELAGKHQSTQTAASYETEANQQSVRVPPQMKDESVETDLEPCCEELGDDCTQIKRGVPFNSSKVTNTETRKCQSETTQTTNVILVDCCTDATLALSLESIGAITCHLCRNNHKTADPKQVTVYREMCVGCCLEKSKPQEPSCTCSDASTSTKPKTGEKATLTDENNRQLDDLQNENEELRELLEEKEEEIEKVMHTNRVSCEKDRDSLTKYREVLGEMGKLRQENEKLKYEIEGLDTEVEKLNGELEKIKKEANVSTTEKVDAIIETASLLHEYETSLEDLNVKYTNAIDELKVLKDENRTLTEKIDLLNESVRQHKEQACLCQLQLQQVNAKTKELESTINDIEDAKEYDWKKTEDGRLIELQRQYDALKGDYDKLLEDNKDIGLLKKQNANLVHELDERDIIINELRSHIAELESELDRVREEMLRSSQSTTKEMDIMMNACSELEDRLGKTRELLEKESEMIDGEVNTTISESCEETVTNEHLRTKLEGRTQELQKLMQELEGLKGTFEGDLQNLKSRNDYLQSKLEHEQAEHQRDIDSYEKKLMQLKQQQVHQISSNVSVGGDKNSELLALLEESLEKNRMLQDELDIFKDQLRALKEAGKEYGVVKTENMKLKSKISLMEQQLDEMKNIEENLIKLRQERDELVVKLQYLEKQLAAARAKAETMKKPALSSIKEEEVVCSKDCAAINVRKPHLVTEEGISRVSANVTILYDNKKFTKCCNTDSKNSLNDSPAYNDKMAKLQMRLVTINRMENQVEEMIKSLRAHNQRVHESNSTRLRTERDIAMRLNNLKQKREQLINNLNSFRNEVQDLQMKSKDRPSNKHCRKQ